MRRLLYQKTFKGKKVKGTFKGKKVKKIKR